jgi:hypothetical protein
MLLVQLITMHFHVVGMVISRSWLCHFAAFSSALHADFQ